MNQVDVDGVGLEGSGTATADDGVRNIFACRKKYVG